MKRERLYQSISIVLAMLGFLITAYLTMQSLTSDTVAGCGGDSGCVEVLTSRWAKLGPIPVSLLGLITYLAVLLGLGARMGSKGYSPLGDRLLWIAPPLLIIASLWFTVVQIVAVGAICPFCMASHGIGFVLACLLIFGVMRTTIIDPKPIIVLSFVAGGLLILGQTMFPPALDAPKRAPNPFADQDGDTWIDDARYISLFGGALQFVLQDVPYIGQPDADHVVAVLFDYACPHCQELHKLLDEAIEKDPKRFVLVPIPLSIYESHNPHLGSDDQRFEFSFERAILSMAVAAVDRAKWQQFDRWLFNADGSGSFPSDRTAARIQAELLIGNAELNDQLTGDTLAKHEATLKRNIALLGLIPEDKRFIPVTTTPGAPEHLTTRYDDIEVLYEWLESVEISDR